ncbi:MAG: hypothetical protein LW832_05490 [Parachlamydia sp.]|jgi:hypothetical protein|nr:hypothetical protein [Parachlamydia sp.]
MNPIINRQPSFLYPVYNPIPLEDHEFQPSNTECFPDFSMEDKIFALLQAYGICDAHYNPAPIYSKFIFSNFNLINHPELIKKFRNFLNKKRVSEGRGEHPFVNNFSYKDIFKWMIKNSDAGISDIDLFGSYLIELAGSRTFFFLFRSLFPFIPDFQLEQWFQQDYIQDFFNTPAQDVDLCIRNNGSLDDQKHYSNQLLSFFMQNMQNFDALHFCAQLKELKPAYAHLHPDSFLVKKHSLLEFGEMTKCKVVDKEQNQFVIFGKKTDDRSFECIFLGGGRPTPSLSSANCFSVSLLAFFQSGGKEVHIKTGPFSAAKVLIDLITNSQSIVDLNVNSWLRYLRNYKRFTRQNMETQLVALLLKEEKEWTGDESYLVHLLKHEIVKAGKETDPMAVFQTLMRGSISLIENATELQDLQLRQLWLDMQQRLNFELGNPAHAFGIWVTKAFLEDQIPFAVIHAWIGMQGLLIYPRTLMRLGYATYGPTHAFCLPLPFQMRIKALGPDHCTNVFSFVESNPESLPVLIKIAESLSDSFISLPAQQLFGLNESHLLHALKWLQQSDVNVKKWAVKFLLLFNETNGRQKDLICMELFALKDDPQFNEIKAAFTQHFIHSNVHSELLDWLAASPSFDAFIAGLVQTKQDSLISFALRFWQMKKGGANPGWRLFKSLLSRHPKKALIHFQMMLESEFIQPAQFVESYLLLSTKIECSFLLSAFMQSLRNNPEKETLFSPLVPYLKDKIAQNPEEGERLLEEACTNGLLNNKEGGLLWLDLLEQRREKSPQSCAVLYYNLIQKEILQLDQTNIQLQNFKIDLGSSLLKEMANPLCERFISELILSPLQTPKLTPLFDGLADYLQSHLAKNLNEQTFFLLGRLVYMTTTSNASRLFMLLDKLSELSLQNEWTDALFLDTAKTLGSCRGCRRTLLTHLQAAQSFRPQLWTLLEIALQLKGPSSEKLLLVETAVHVFKRADGIPPSPLIQRWLEQKQNELLTLLVENKKYHAALQILKTLHACNISPLPSNLEEMHTYFLNLDNAFNERWFLFQLVFPKNILSDDFPALKRYIGELLQHNDLPYARQASKLLKILLTNGSEVDSQLLINCLEQLKNRSENFDFLSSIQVPSQISGYQNRWIEAARELSSIAPLARKKALFLAPQACHFLDDLYPLAEKALKDHLEQGELTESETEIMIELFETYTFKDKNLWILFLSNISLKCSPDTLTTAAQLFIDRGPLVSLEQGDWYYPAQLLCKSDLILLPFLDQFPFEFCIEGLQKELSRLSLKNLDEKKYNSLLIEKEKIGERFPSLKVECQKAFIHYLLKGVDKEILPKICTLIHQTCDIIGNESIKVSPFLPAAIEKCMIQSYKLKSYEYAEGLFKRIISSPDYPNNSMIRILSAFKKFDPLLIPFILPTLDKILINGSLKDLQTVKSTVLKLLPEAFKHMPLELVKEGEEVLDKIIKGMELSQRQQINLIEAYLNRLPALLKEAHPLRAIKIYQRWLPSLQPCPESLERHIEQAVNFTIPFTAGPHTSLEKFNTSFQAIIHLSHHEKIKKSRPKYLGLCLNQWKKHKCSYLIQTAFLNYCHILANKFSEGKATALAVLDSMEALVFCWPLPPIQEVATFQFFYQNDPETINFNFQNDLKILFLEAYNKNVFKDNLGCIVKYNIYLNLQIPNLFVAESLIHSTTKGLINKMIAYDTPSALLSAIRILEQWEGSYKETQWKELAALAEKIGRACIRYPLAVAHKQTLLHCLYEKTVSFLPKEQELPPLAKKNLERVLNSLYEISWEAYCQLGKQACHAFTSHYLQLCFEIVVHHLTLQDGSFESQFAKRLTQLMPEVLRSEIEYPSYDTDRTLKKPEKGTLVGFYNFLLIHIKPANEEEKKILLQYFIRWLNALMKEREPEAAALCCEYLCQTLLELIETSIFTCREPAAVKCYQKVIQWIPSYCNQEDRYWLEFFNLAFYYGELIQNVPQLIERFNRFTLRFLNLGSIHAHQKGLERLASAPSTFS